MLQISDIQACYLFMNRCFELPSTSNRDIMKEKGGIHYVRRKIQGKS